MLGDCNRILGKRSAAGLTLVEVMVALGLIAISLMLILGLVPAGVHSAQRASDVQSATAWSRQLLESTPPPSEFPIPASEATSSHEMKIGKTWFRATRRLTSPGPYLYRIEVETTWDDGSRPLQLSLTRFSPGGPDS